MPPFGRCRLAKGVEEKGGESWEAALENVRRAATARGRAGVGGYAIEGTRAHERALRAGVPLESVLLGRGLREEPSSRERRLLEDLERSGCRVHVVPDEILTCLTDGRKIGAIVGLVRRTDPPALSEIVRLSAGRVPLVLVAVDVEDPGNVGALTRTALASGAGALIAVGISDPFHPRAVRVSMGSVFKLPILSYPDLPGCMRELAPSGLRSVAAVCSGGVPLPRARFGDRGVALFVGSEAFGLSDEASGIVDELVTVPMTPAVDSFSVNAAAAVILYEIGRES